MRLSTKSIVKFFLLLVIFLSAKISHANTVGLHDRIFYGLSNYTHHDPLVLKASNLTRDEIDDVLYIRHESVTHFELGEGKVFHYNPYLYINKKENYFYPVGSIERRYFLDSRAGDPDARLSIYIYIPSVDKIETRWPRVYYKGNSKNSSFRLRDFAVEAKVVFSGDKGEATLSFSPGDARDDDSCGSFWVSLDHDPQTGVKLSFPVDMLVMQPLGECLIKVEDMVAATVLENEEVVSGNENLSEVTKVENVTILSSSDSDVESELRKNEAYRPEVELGPTHFASLYVEDSSLISSNKSMFSYNGEQIPIVGEGLPPSEIREAQSIYISGGQIYLSINDPQLEENIIDLRVDNVSCRNAMISSISVTKKSLLQQKVSDPADIVKLIPETISFSACQSWRKVDLHVVDVPPQSKVEFGYLAGDSKWIESDFIGSEACNGLKRKFVYCVDERAFKTSEKQVVRFSREGFKDRIIYLENHIDFEKVSKRLSFPYLESNTRTWSIFLESGEWSNLTVSIGSPSHAYTVSPRGKSKFYEMLNGIDQVKVDIKAKDGYILRYVDPSGNSLETSTSLSATIATVSGGLSSYIASHKPSDSFISLEVVQTKIDLRSLPITLRLPLPNENKLNRYCQPGLEFDRGVHWLDEYDSDRWIYPDSKLLDLQSSVGIRVRPLSTRHESSCPPEGTVVSTMTLAELRSDGFVDVPFSRPLVIYVSRSTAFDSRIGSRNSADYWKELLTLANLSSQGRVLILRQFRGIDGFDSLLKPTSFLATNDLKVDDVLRRTSGRHTASVGKILDDAVQLSALYGRSDMSVGLDVLVLSADLQDCRSISSSLNASDGARNLRIAIIGDSAGADIDFEKNSDEGEAALGKICESTPEFASVVLSDVNRSIDNNYWPLYPKNSWQEVLSIFDK